MIITDREPVDERLHTKRILVTRLGIAASLLLPWVPAAVFAVMNSLLFALIIWSYPLWVIVCGIIAYQRFRGDYFSSALIWASIPLWAVGVFFLFIFVLGPIAVMANNPISYAPAAPDARSSRRLLRR